MKNTTPMAGAAAFTPEGEVSMHSGVMSKTQDNTSKQNSNQQSGHFTALRDDRLAR